MRTAVLVLCLVAAAVVAEVDVVLPRGVVSALPQQTADAGTLADVLAGLAHARPAHGTPLAHLPRQAAFASLTAPAPSSLLLVLEGVSFAELDRVPLTKKALEGQAHLASYGSVLDMVGGVAERVGDAREEAVSVYAVSASMQRSLAPSTYPYTVPAVPAGFQCGAADVAGDLELACTMVDSLPQGHTFLSLHALIAAEDESGKDSEEYRTQLAAMDAVVAALLAKQGAATSVVMTPRAVQFIEVPQGNAAETPSKAPTTYVVAGTTLLMPDPNIARFQILLWFCVVIVLALIAAIVAMFGVGVDATKDTLLYRSTTTF